ncbi:MAG: adenylate/guanylate cyclase domain-containing protein [bacterium]|jgi:adenylate cyclase
MNHHKFIFLFFLAILFCSGVSAQDSALIELTQKIALTGQDTSRVDLLIELSRYHVRTAPDTAILICEEAEELAEKLNYQNGIATALKYIGMAYYFQGRYLETIQYWKRSRDVFEKAGNTKGVANMLSNIGAIYFNQGDDTKAIEMYLQTLKVAEEIEDSLRIATVLNNIGGVYFNKTNTREKSLGYYLKAYEISQHIGNAEAIGTSAVNTGDYYLWKENADSALYFFNKSLEAMQRSVSGNVSYTLNSIGEAYALKNDYDQAVKYQNEALELATRNNSALDKTLALIALGNTYVKKGEYKNAVSYFLRAEVIARELKVNYQIKNTFEALAKTYASMSDYEKAYQYQKLFSDYKDTIYNAENDKKIQRLQFNYDLEKKQAEVDILTRDKQLQELTIQKQKFTRNALIVGIALVLIIAFITFRNYLHKVKVNRLLDRQKAQIESLLLNILPAKVAEELQLKGKATPRNYKSVTVLFTDFKSFTRIAEGLTPGELVTELNTFFEAFDSIVEKYKLEKIKTIGDAYMCAGGLPTETSDHCLQTVKVGLEMQEVMKSINEERKKNGLIPWELRVGIHTGPVVAGVVGKKKYAYDIWGSTVNIASRMESNGEPGKVNISAASYAMIRDHYQCHYRGKIEAKNVGEVDMYFVEQKISREAV